jgi:hypothetical protein
MPDKCKLHKCKPHKCKLLADRINKIFIDGINLDREVVHYIDSTFLNPSVGEIEEIICNDQNSGNESLVELILFPDQPIQTILERTLAIYEYEKHDEEKVLEYLFIKQPKVTVYFQDNPGVLQFEPQRWPVRQFISRLSISKKLDERVCLEINQSIPYEPDACLAKVKIRNARLIYSEDTLLFLCDFFRNMVYKDSDFFSCLDYVLEFLEEIGKDKDILKALIEKKRFYIKRLQKCSKFEQQLKRNNVETLILKRAEMPCDNIEELHEKIRTIDRISLAVFGRVEDII